MKIEKNDQPEQETHVFFLGEIERLKKQFGDLPRITALTEPNVLELESPFFEAI